MNGCAVLTFCCGARQWPTRPLRWRRPRRRDAIRAPATAGATPSGSRREPTANAPTDRPAAAGLRPRAAPRPGPARPRQASSPLGSATARIRSSSSGSVRSSRLVEGRGSRPRSGRARPGHRGSAPAGCRSPAVRDATASACAASAPCSDRRRPRPVRSLHRSSRRSSPSSPQFESDRPPDHDLLDLADRLRRVQALRDRHRRNS